MVDAGYVRTSKEDQHPENQVNLMIKEGVRPENIFVDAGLSGSLAPDEREGYRRMRRFLETNKVEHLYVFEISRLGRSFLDTLTKTLQIENQGTRVWSLSPLESWTRIEDKNLRELMLSIFSWAAQRERENLIERTKAGIARAKSEGKHCGRPFREINWKKYEEYRNLKLSISAISRLMDVPYSTLRRHQLEKIRKTPNSEKKEG